MKKKLQIGEEQIKRFLRFLHLKQLDYTEK